MYNPRMIWDTWYIEMMGDRKNLTHLTGLTNFYDARFCVFIQVQEELPQSPRDLHPISQ